MLRRARCGSWSRIDPFLEGFQRAVLERGSAEIGDFLPDTGDECYADVLREVVRADLEFHWRSGQPKMVESYLAAFPALAADRAGLAEIAFEEFRLRRRAGQSPSPEEYLGRLGVDLHSCLVPPIAAPKATGNGVEGPDGGHGADVAVAGGPLGRQAADVSIATAFDPSDEPPSFEGFRLDGELGRGAFARVFIAHQIGLADRLVVLKVSSYVSGEEVSLAQLQHSNIVPVYSCHGAGPFQAICMPYFGATTLADVVLELQALGSVPDSARWLTELVRRRRRTDDSVSETALLDLERRRYVDGVLVLAAQIAEGLEYAHERGIVHRDLKPANVLLSDEGRPMLLDFNLSQDARRGTPARDGGTLAYMAPETLESIRDGGFHSDARSDLYSLGLVLYELLCGDSPFPIGEARGRKGAEEMIGLRRGPRPDARRRNPAISPAVASIVGRCLEPDPGLRYRSADELRADIERHLTDRPLRFAPDPSLRERASKWIRRHPRLTSSYAVGMVSALLLLGLALLYAHRGYRLAALEARRNVEEFRDDLRVGRFLVTGPSIPTEERAQGYHRARRAAGRFRVLDRDDWQSAPEYQLLPGEDQADVRRGLTEALLYLAYEEAGFAAVAPDAGRAAHLVEALRLNGLAERCSESEEDRVGILLQRSRLRELAGDRSVGGDVEPLALPKTAHGLCVVALVRMNLGQYQTAAEILRDAIRLDPQDPFVYYALGACELALGRPEEATAHLDTSIALWPGFYRSYFLRAGAKAERKEYRAALADFDEAIRLQHEFLAAYADRAITKAALGDFAGAIKDLSHSLRDGRPTRLYFVRARIRQMAGDPQGAGRDYQEGLSRQPNDELSWVARGLARARRSPADALGDFDEALKLNNRSIPALEAKANVLSEQLGRTGEAIRVLDGAVRLHPEYPTFRSGRGVLLARLGRREDALLDARESLRLSDRPEVTYQVAGIYALTSRRNPADRVEALRLLRSAFRQGYGLDLIDRDPELDPIRALPEFRRLVDAARGQGSDVLPSSR